MVLGGQCFPDSQSYASVQSSQLSLSKGDSIKDRCVVIAWRFTILEKVTIPFIHFLRIYIILITVSDMSSIFVTFM